MKFLMTAVVSLLVVGAGFIDSAVARPPENPQQSKEASADERSVLITAGPPCALARAVAEQLGRLSPQVKALPNAQAFAATNGDLKVLVACGMTDDETYTYNRLLSNLGIGLLSLQKDEAPQKVVQELADKLKLSYQPPTSAKLPLTFVFAGQGANGKAVRLTVQAAKSSSAPVAAAKVAAVPAKVAATPAKVAAVPAAPITAAPVKTAPTLAVPTKAAVPAPPVRTAYAPARTLLPATVHTDAATRAPAPTTGGENLYDLYLLAKANDPDLGRSRSRYLATQADTKIARAGLRPRVNADFGLSWIDQSTYNSGPSTLTSSVFGFNYDLVASAPLLHFPYYYNLASAKAAERGEEAGVVATRQNLIFKLGSAYFGVLKARGDEQISRDEISRVRQALEQAQAFLKSGTGDIIAVYEAQARLDSVMADLNRNQSGLTLAQQRLSSIVGRVVSSIVDQVPSQPKSAEPADIEWWLATMEKNDPQIWQAQEGLASTIQQTKSAKAEHLPVIDASGGFDVSKGAAYAPSTETRQWHVGATVTVPLYSGGETSARIQRANAYETERRYALDQVREQRRDNLKQAYFNLSYNVSQIKALEQREASALVQLNATRRGRDIGTRTAIDLLNGEAAYAVAQRDLKSALYDNVVRIIELKAAAGVLTEEDLR